ncbi:glycosyltransferase family 4 protein [Thomasclavelia saccharogumia]|uniref:glycosyltransferase family 4 protein n=1 Tax=Thomasclavelia saccharogumia TaxID=341225 RepID=UPI000478C688|nr:glycosyltransferase family 4 protein [Thomasclavelia saccharogumia]
MKKICYVVTIPTTIRAFFLPQFMYLSKNGFDVTVICNYDAQLVEELGKDIKFIPVKIPRGISIFNSINTIQQLIKIFKREKFDLIQYSTPNAALYSAIAAKKAKCLIRNYHCMGFRYLGFKGILKYIFKLIEQITCFLSTHVECVSYSNLELGIREKIFNKDKATVIFYGSTGGVDFTKFNIEYREKWRNEIRKKYNLKNDDFIYGFIGRITRDKGINELLEAFFSLNNNTKLLFVGEVEKKNHLDAILFERAKKDKNIIFIGSVNEVEKYYAAIDVLILPSYREGFGNVVIEAEAMGTPVIVSDIPGPRDAMEAGKTGYLFQSKNVSELKEKMQHINNNKLIKQLSSYSCEYAKNRFSSEILNKYILKRKLTLIEENKVF